MTVREYKSEDRAKVCSLHERSCAYPLPDVDRPLYLAKHIVEENNRIVGFGCLKLTSEAIIAIDIDESTKIRAQAVQELIRTGVYKCQKLGLTEMHAFLTGSNQQGFERVLQKHYGFSGHSGKVLVLEV